MSERLERLTNLVALLLDAKVPLTLDNIASELGLYPPDPENRRATFERDKKLLRDEGIPITVVPLDQPVGTSGYLIRAEDFYLPKIDLTESEEVALQLAMVSIPTVGGWSDGALLKLGGRQSASTQALYELPVAPALPDVYHAARTRSRLRFTYTDRRGNTASRTVDPYGAVCRRGFWYLVGFCHDREAIRTFRIDRIDVGALSVGPPGSFVRPEGFNVAAAITDDPKLLGTGETTQVLVLVDSSRAWLVEQERGSSAVYERRTDGSIVIAVDVNHVPAFRTWLLAFGEHAEVLGPVPIRDAVVEWLTEMAT